MSTDPVALTAALVRCNSITPAEGLMIGRWTLSGPRSKTVIFMGVGLLI